MAWYIATVTIKTGEGYTSPGQPIELDENDAKALAGYIREPRAGEIPGLDDLEIEQEGEPVDQDPAKPEGDDEGSGEGDDATGADEGGSAEGSAENGSSEPPSRIERVLAALNALGPDDFFEGGKPKKKALGEWLEFKPTDEEIDAALKLKAEAL